MANFFIKKFKINQKIFFSCRFGLDTKFFSTTFFTRESDFKINKALIVRKVTRYEYEKYILKPGISEKELKMFINNKGSNYDQLLERHEEYAQSLIHLENCLEKLGIKYRLVQRYNFRPQFINWADLVITSGGDGTFLTAASKIQVPDKPIIGFNSDPDRSEGFLCLPRSLSLNVEETLNKLIKNQFKWFWRQRIRMTLQWSDEPPFDLYDHQVLEPESKFFQERKIQGQVLKPLGMEDKPNTRVLPVLALNEVFVGEKLSARVSFYEISIDGSLREKHKSSGLMVCPGTGSTAWFFSSNNMSRKNISNILKIANKYGLSQEVTKEDLEKIKNISQDYNSSLIFNPSELKMAYSVRDPMSSGVFQIISNTRGFCRHIVVKSRMWDACVVIDGNISYNFNDGAELELSIHPEDAILCMRVI